MTIPDFMSLERKRTLADYELSDKEFAQYAKMSWAERLERNICPECMHKMLIEPEFGNKRVCLQHGTKEQINMYKPVEKKRKFKK